MEKIMVCDGIKDLKEFLEKHKNKKICLYLTEKTKEAWDISTSRVYMNQIDDRFIYLPVNIKKGDFDSIREVYKLAENEEQIVAINQTQPHKSNPVQKEWFSSQDIPQNVDSLIKDKNNKLQCYNLNGPSFTSWFEDEITHFSDNIVIVFGVGGVGEPIARMIANVNTAKQYGWEAYTGFGMNSRNDYVLLQKIQEITDINIPSFVNFSKLVAAAS